MRLGIDFGTSFSSAAFVRSGRLVAVKEPLRGQSPSIPTVVAVDGAGRLEVGVAALNSAPDRRCSEFKQYLGEDDWPLVLGGQEYRPTELVSAVLACLREEATAAGAAADGVVLTVPASYGPHRQELMRTAAITAGFQSAEMLEEPVAAAVYYTAEGGLQAATGDVLLVYDLGGGTFDAALIKRTAGGWETLAAAGIPDCGGIDFDTLIFQDLTGQLDPDIQSRLQPGRELSDDARLDALYARQQAREFCHELKEILSARQEQIAVARLAVPPHPHPTYTLTRQRFEEMIAPLIEETLELCDGLVHDTGTQWQRISQILLVGGSCRIPYIRRALEQFNRPVLRVDDLELAVAYGAALHANRDKPQSGCHAEAFESAATPEEKLADLNHVLKDNPNDAGALAARAETQLKLANPDEALSDLQRALQLRPNDASALALRGLTHWVLERPNETLADATSALAFYQDDAVLLGLRGDALRRLGRFDDALANLSRALELNPDNAAPASISETDFELETSAVLAWRGDTLRHLDRLDEALADLNRALTFDPDNLVALTARGQTHSGRGDLTEALADLNRVLTKTPDDVLCLATRGDVYLRLDRHEEALADLNRAVKLNPDDASTLATRGQTYWALGQYNEALASFNSALERNRENVLALGFRGRVHLILGHFGEALADFDRALRVRPNDASILARRGETLRVLDRYDDALADLNRALEREPDDVLALNARGDIYRLRGRLEEALADLNRALALEAQNGFALGRRGDILRVRGRLDEALADFNRALELLPRDALALRGRGGTLARLGRFSEAVADYTRALEINQNDAVALTWRGDSRRALRRFDEALGDYNRALGLNPNIAVALAARGDTLRVLGRHAEALLDLDRALQLDPNQALARKSRALAIASGNSSATVSGNNVANAGTQDAEVELKKSRNTTLRYGSMNAGTLTLTNQRLTWKAWAAARPALDLRLENIVEVKKGNTPTGIVVSLADGRTAQVNVTAFNRTPWIASIQEAVRHAHARK